ncbi:MAG: tetratricopeptide repeat protein [Cytophagales bacterium]|nr:tetratricopeptide repeat protein [Cytophagales bacterium]
MFRFLFFLSFIALFNLSLFAQDEALAKAYIEKGDFEKALVLLEKIVKKDHDLDVYENYRTVLVELKEWEKLEKYLKKKVKKQAIPLFEVDYALVFKAKDDVKKTEKLLEKLFEKYKYDVPRTIQTGKVLKTRGEVKYGIKLFEQGSKNDKYKAIYIHYLVDLYIQKGDKKKVARSYVDWIINSVVSDKDISKVQRTLQPLLSSEDYENLVKIVYEQLPNHSENIHLLSLLSWAHIQTKDFYEAFVQLRSLDQLRNEGGRRLQRLGYISLNNKDYNTAQEIFEYLASTYSTGSNYVNFKKQAIKAQELSVKSVYPVENAKINALIADYDTLLLQTRSRLDKGEIMRNQALLYAFHLQDYSQAIELLNNVKKVSSRSSRLWANSLLDLADIYILTEEPWESTLLYLEVEKTLKESDLAQIAKFKNAKLSYYKGDFELSRSHLDILKLATTREIANDAIDLSLLIQNNTALDTSDIALRKYASIDLLVYKKQYKGALEAIVALEKELETHNLQDELLWLQSAVYFETKQYTLAEQSLLKIIQDHSDGILADNAYFKLANLYEQELNNPQKAMEFYKQIIIEHSNSIYVMESRKKYRKLRGDFK